MKKHIVALSFLCLSLFSLSAIAANPTRDVFVQTAPHASITKSAEPHTYELALNNIQDYATYFSDRPSRTSNIMSLDSFLNLWSNENKGFGKDAPNASISGVTSNHKMVNFPAELTKPSYNTASKTLTYIIHPLEGKESTIPSDLSLNHVSLFIDPLCLSCLG